jgi:hypothetical protein
MRNWGNKMKKIGISCLLFLPLILLAYSDSDFDGVADEHDMCPNSEMTDIVDMSGCSVEKLVLPKDNPHHFNLIVGANYLNNNTLNESLQVDYYYKKFTLRLQTANYEDGGLGDSSLGVYYTFSPKHELSFKIGALAIFPTYDTEFDNNNMDYKASLAMNYQLDTISLFGGVGYTLINDDNINSSTYKITYQNSQSYYFGFGSYFISKLYSSLIYSSSSSIYKGGDTLSNLSFYNYYNIDKKWFTSFGYSQGLTDSSLNQLYINLGYHF